MSRPARPTPAAPAELPAIDSLRCFVAAAEHLNFRTAARAVALTPAAVGQRIRLLEQQLGAALFVRTTRSVRLTDAGLSLLPRARACLAEAAACLRAVAEADPPIELTLGTRFELGMSWIVPSLPRLAAALPRVTVHLYFGSGPEILERLRGGQVDCVVTSAKLDDGRVLAERLHEERYAFVAAPALLAGRPLERPEDVARHVLLDIDARTPLLAYFTGAPTAPALPRFGGHRWLGCGAAVKEQALAGEGVAVLPLYMIEGELRAGRLRRVFPAVAPLSDHFRLLHRDHDPRQAVYRALAAELAQLPIS